MPETSHALTEASHCRRVAVERGGRPMGCSRLTSPLSSLPLPHPSCQLLASGGGAQQQQGGGVHGDGRLGCGRGAVPSRRGGLPGEHLPAINTSLESSCVVIWFLWFLRPIDSPSLVCRPSLEPSTRLSVRAFDALRARGQGLRALGLGASEAQGPGQGHRVSRPQAFF